MRACHVACALRIALAGSAVVASSVADAQASSASVVAIVVPATSRDTSLSLAQLRRIFAGEQQFWSDGSRIILLVPQRGTRERAAVLRVIYQTDEAGFIRYWIAKTFRDEVTAAPKLMPSSDMTLRLLKALPGAVGVVAWPMSASDAVRQVRVNDRLPGDAGYALTARR